MNSILTQSFKGSYQQTQSGIPYYKSNTGTIIGGSLAGLCTITAATNFYKKSYALGAIGLGTAAAHLLCGVIYDKLRNKKSQEFAEKVANPDMKMSLVNDKNVGLSQNKSPYYKSNMGLKYGTITGAIVGLGTGIVDVLDKSLWKESCNAYQKVFGEKLNKPKLIVAVTLCMIPFGIIMGKIADYFSNKDAYKNT